MLGGEEVVKVAFGPLHFAARWVRQVLERTKRHMCYSKQLKPRPPNATDGKQPSPDRDPAGAGVWCRRAGCAVRDSLPRAVTLTDRQPARPRAAQPGRQQVRRANTRMYASASAVCMVVAACGVLRTLVVELGVSLRVDVGEPTHPVASERRALCVTRCARVRLTHVSQDTRANFACWSFAPPIWQGEGATGKPSGLSRLLPVWCSSSYR